MKSIEILKKVVAIDEALNSRNLQVVLRPDIQNSLFIWDRVVYTDNIVFCVDEFDGSYQIEVHRLDYRLQTAEFDRYTSTAKIVNAIVKMLNRK